MFNRKELRIDCACSQLEHTIFFESSETTMGFSEDEDSYVVITNHLTQFNLFKRIWVAIKYVFGYRCRYGDFEETIIDVEKAKQLRDFLDRFVNYQV
jgi:hypothetical protein